LLKGNEEIMKIHLVNTYKKKCHLYNSIIKCINKL
jgi:hypothetical protein